MADERVVDVRQRLITAAAAVFSERGYEGTSVHEIARRAGLTTGAIYSQFSGKAELLVEAIDAAIPEEIERLLAGQVDDAPPDIIARLGSQLLDDELYSDDPLVLEAIVAGRREPAVGERVARRFEEEDSQLAKLVEEGKAAGLVGQDLDTHAVVAFCHAVGMGMQVTRVLGRPLPDPAAWDHLIARLVAAVTTPQENR